jgi:hypothetical protein
VIRLVIFLGLALCLTHTCGPARAETTTNERNEHEAQSKTSRGIRESREQVLGREREQHSGLHPGGVPAEVPRSVRGREQQARKVVRLRTDARPATAPDNETRRVTTTERALRVACGPGAVYLAPAVDAAARRYLHHPVLLVTLIRRESHCRPDAIGKRGEVGLGQLHGRARNGLSRKALLDPATNLMTTARWLALMEVWAGGTFAGLGAYNTGKRGKGKRYARRVLATVRRIMATNGKDGKR